VCSIIISQFVSRYICTIGVDYGVKSVMVDGCEVKVNFWDLSGHPEFFEVRNEFYKDAQGVSAPLNSPVS
jgi:DnaJ family protein C protein 27